MGETNSNNENSSDAEIPKFPVFSEEALDEVRREIVSAGYSEDDATEYLKRHRHTDSSTEPSEADTN